MDDDTTLDWMTLTLRPSEVVSEPAAATDDCLPRIRYTTARESISALVVTVECTEHEENLLSDLLLAYGREWADLCGRDRVCLHDAAFEAIHGFNCDLIAYDCLAETLLIEIGALLAENRVATR